MSSVYFIVSIYIVSFLLGAVVTTLTIIFAAKEKNDINRIFKYLSLALLFFVIFEFYVYYQISSGISTQELFAMMLLSNGCYYIFIYLWIRLLYMLSGRPMRKRAFLIIIALYGTCGEIIGLLNMQYDPSASYFQIKEGLWHQLLMVADITFAFWIFYLVIRSFAFAAAHMVGDPHRKGVIAFSAILFLYMIWVLVWDYQMINGRSINSSDLYALDPMVVFYITYSFAAIWLFLTKNPLGIGVIGAAGTEGARGFSSPSSEQDTARIKSGISAIAAEYALTERETEVLEQLYYGFSNPVIGRNLFIAENTVKRHMNNIFRKTETKGRYELLTLLNKHV